MHSIELEKKVRLPDPTKAMEGVWKLLRRTKQQLNVNAGNSAAISGSAGQALLEKMRARMEADRQKARGISYALRTTVR